MRLPLLCSLLLLPSVAGAAAPLVPADWDAQEAGDRVLAGLVRVTGPQVKGAHDAEMVLTEERAYIVAKVNDDRAGESADWPEIYCAMSIVRLDTLEVEAVIPFGRGGQVFENLTLPAGTCFVPRIIQMTPETLRCYFANEQPGRRQAQIWSRDFHIPTRRFAPTIHKVKLKTAEGVADMEPRHLHADAVREGFDKPAKDHGMYIFDSFKSFDGRIYTTVNNFKAKQNAFAVLHDDFTTVEILGHLNEPQTEDLSESAVNRLPDGSWMAILRNDAGGRNYFFAVSRDGVNWEEAREMPFVPNGWNSKPTFDRFNGVYYLGWQESTQVDGAHRSVFNIDVSRDGKTWVRKYRFETAQSFQYPSFHAYDGAIWLCVTQGDASESRKERIMFGRLEELP